MSDILNTMIIGIKYYFSITIINNMTSIPIGILSQSRL